MTDRDWPEDDEELDQHYDGTDEPEPTTRLSPAAREHLAAARAALARPSDGRRA